MLYIDGLPAAWMDGLPAEAMLAWMDGLPAEALAKAGGRGGIRTPDLLGVNEML